MDKKYIYCCYEIKSRDDSKDEFIVGFDECECFTLLSLAVEFCKRHYAKYVIAVEKCTEDLWDDVDKTQGD